MAASVEDILDEILMGDNDSETEQLVESAGLQRVADMEEKLEAQIKTCLEAFNELDLGNNVHIFKESVRKQIKGSFQAFKPPTDPLKILLNVSLNCGSLFKTESKFWLQKIIIGLQENQVSRPRTSVKFNETFQWSCFTAYRELFSVRELKTLQIMSHTRMVRTTVLCHLHPKRQLLYSFPYWVA